MLSDLIFFIIVVLSKRCFEAQFAFSKTRSFQEVLNDIGNRCGKPMIKTVNRQNTAKIMVSSEISKYILTQTFW